MGVLDFIKAAALSHRQGWILLIAGTGIALLSQRLPVTLGGSEWFTVPIGAIMMVIGAAIIVTDIGQALYGKAGKGLSDARAKRAAASAAAAEEARIGAEAVANLAVLDKLEIDQLTWIFRNNQRRFSGNLGSSRLQNMHIVSPAIRWENSVWIVHDNVWSQREQWLNDHRRLPDMKELPRGGSWAAY